MIIAAPSDENECRLLLSTCYQTNSPSAVRYPRGTGTGATVSDGLETVEIGKGIIRREGEKIAVIAFGSMVTPSLTAADKLNATVADMRFVKPIDEELIVRLARSHDYIVTAEENAEQGGAGSAVLGSVGETRHLQTGIAAGYRRQSYRTRRSEKLLADLGLNAEAVEKRIGGWIETV